MTEQSDEATLRAHLELCRTLRGGFLVSHVGADFDALASLVCARRLYPELDIYLPGSCEPKVEAFLRVHGEALGLMRWKHGLTQADPQEPQGVYVLVDVAQPGRLGDLRPFVEEPGVVVHVYDHHPVNEQSILGDHHCVQPVGACATLLLELLRAASSVAFHGFSGSVLTPLEATLCALALHEETGSFTYPTTTARDLEAMAWLVQQGGVQFLEVETWLHRPLEERPLGLEDQLLSEAREYQAPSGRLVLCHLSLPRWMGDLAPLVTRLLARTRADSLFLVASWQGRATLIGRSRAWGLDVGRALAPWGGGGHARAASASVKVQDVEVLVQALGDHLCKLPAPLTLGARMRTPVTLVALESEAGADVASAVEYLQRVGQDVVVAVHHENVLGVLLRSDLERALRLGQTLQGVAALVRPAPVLEGPNLALGEAVRALLDGLAPVLIVGHGPSPQGLFGREQLYESLDDLVEPIFAPASAPLHLLPVQGRALLERCSRTADQQGLRLYLVGGMVRDLLLGEVGKDLDLVVEGSGPAFAEALVRELGGRVQVHAHFGTARIDLTDADAFCPRIDVATARVEYYARPAALPEVAGSSIKNDMARRDFTVNALAITLNHDARIQGLAYGTVLDFYGGRRDLQHKVIRALHPLSFVEDPTRMLRAIRYEQRLGYRIEGYTSQCMQQAAADQVWRTLSPKRLRDALLLLLDEPDPPRALRRLAQFKLLAMFSPSLHWSEKLGQLLLRCQQQLALSRTLLERAHGKPHFVYLLALLSALSEHDARQAIDALGLHLAGAHFLGPTAERELLSRLHHPGLTPGGLYALLAPWRMEMLVYLKACSRSEDVHQALDYYLGDLCQRPTLVRGADLLAWGWTPGPSVGKVLATLRQAQFDGAFDSLAGARAWLEQQDIGPLRP